MSTDVVEKIDWAQRHEPAMRARIVGQYQLFVQKKIAVYGKKYPWADKHDIESAAYEGLLRSIDGYDESQSCFLAYAGLRLRGSILDSLRSASPFSRKTQSLTKKRKRAEATLTQQLGRYPTDQEVSDEAGLTPEQYTESNLAVINLRDQANALNRIDRLSLSSDTMRQYMRGLDLQGQTILYLHYCKQVSMLKIGEVLGVSMSRISQIHAKLIAKMQKMPRDQFRDK